MAALLDGADFAKGTRFAKGGGSGDITRLRRLGNRLLTGVVNLMYGTSYTDLCYGYNAFWRKHLPVLELKDTAIESAQGDTKLWGDGFEIETLINIRIAKADLAVVEVPSFEHSRIHGVSNLSAASDGLRVLRTVLHERLQPRRRRRLDQPGRPGHRTSADIESSDMAMVAQQEPSLDADVVGGPDHDKLRGSLIRPRHVRNSLRR